MIAASFLYYFILQAEDMERFFTSLLHLLSYYILICILMIIFLGRKLKE